MTRVETIREKLGEKGLDALLLFSDTNIRYAARFYITDGAALITRDRAYLLTDSRYIEAAREQAKNVEALLFDHEHPLKDRLAALLGECKGELLLNLGAEEKSLSHAAWNRWQEQLDISLVPAEQLLLDLRAVKDADEVESIVKAQRIAEAALEEVLPLIRPGIREREIAAELTYRMLLRGGEGNSFDPIAITGANTSRPHGVPGDVAVQPGDFVTMDFGTICNGYHSDMTRTVAVGFATDEMRRVYDTVLEAQEAGINAARAGVTGAAVHAAAADVIAAAGYGEYFGHGFGHSVGLEIHEAPNASPRNEKPLPAGAVVTAEPGIYIPGKFGVRIEDMLLLRDGGAENLTAAPKELLVL